MNETKELPKMQNYLPRFSIDEIDGLLSYSDWKLKQDKHINSMRWLKSILHDEKSRRDRSLSEPGMLDFPFVEGSEVSDALMAFFVMSRAKLTTNQAAFADEVLLHTIGSAIGILELCHAT